MPFTRRIFFSGVTQGLAATAASGWLGELLPDSAGDDRPKRAPAQVARILFNENPLGPSPLALQALREVAGDANYYPFLNAGRLEMKLRAGVGLPTIPIGDVPVLGKSERPVADADLMLGVGSSEILRAVAWWAASQPGNVVEPYPSYAALGREAASCPGANIERRMVNLDAENKIDVQAMIDATDEQTRVVMVCNPNNPTGTLLEPQAIAYLVEQIPESTIVFIDEAYIDFLDDPAKHTAIPFALSRPNVIVTRTFSKIHGLAGLRVGYGVGNTELLDQLRPYMLGQLSFNLAGIAAATAALDDQDHLQKTVRLNQRIQQRWANEMPEFGFKYTPSHAGFAWVDTGRDCTPMLEDLASKGVLIGSGHRWNLPSHVRISLGNDHDVNRLMDAIAQHVA